MRVGRHLRLAILGILAAGVVDRDPAFSADEVHETHPHQAESCSTCHMGSRAVAPEDRRDNACATCHDLVSPVEYSLGAWGPDGFGEGPKAGAVLPSGSEDPFLGDARVPDSSGDRDDASSGTVAAEWTTAAAGLDDHGSRCTRCHSFHAPTRIAFANREADIASPKVANHCITCHSHSDPTRLARLTDGHRAAAALYHWMGSDLAAYTLSDACLICHDQSQGLPMNLPAFLPVTPRFDTHASHPYGIRMAGTGDFFRPVIDSRIQLFDGQIECQTCHDLSAQNEDLIVVFETKYEMCRGCHTQGLPQGRFQDGLVQR